MRQIYLSEASKFILERLNENGEEAYIVGGSVRDQLMGKTPSDFDVTTSARPDRIEEIFSDCKLISLGKNYGTIGIFYKDELVETTTYRCDGVYKDGRHPEEVTFSDSLEEDLKRRDFTINAMAMDVSGDIVDIFAGQEDLKNKIIRCVGDPIKRFKEDKLRMLRAVRFANRFLFEIEEKTLEGIKTRAEHINLVSKERIRVELDKILLSDQPAQGLELLLETNLLEEIFPELMPTVGYDQMSPYHHKDLFKHILCTVNRVDKKIHLRLAALFHDIAKPLTLSVDEEGVGHFFDHDCLGAEMAGKILRRYKYDNETIRKVKTLIDRHMKAQPGIGTKGLKRLINRVGEDLIFDLFDLMLADLLCTRDDRDPTFLLENREKVKEILEARIPLSKKELAVNGNDLLEIGYKEGKQVGKTLDRLMDLVLEDDKLNDKEKLLDIAKKILLEEV